MSKKICGLFVVPLLLVCLLSSCKPKEEPTGEPKPTVTASVKSDFPPEPQVQEKRDHCLQVTGPANDGFEYQYRYCYYPYDKADVTAGRYRCSTDVKNCIEKMGECARTPAQQKQPC